MTDPISSALNLAKLTGISPNISTNAPATINAVGGATAASALGAANAVSDKILDKLPTVKNPELVKKQIEAEIEIKKIELEELKTLIKEQGIQIAKDKLKELALASIPALPIPITDPKLLQAVALAKQAKILIEEKRKNSEKNLDNVNKKLEFPMKVPNLQVPTIPEVPKIPEIPKISIPKLP